MPGLLVKYKTIYLKIYQRNEGIKIHHIAQESRWVVRIGALDVCITRSGALSSKGLVDDDGDYVIVRVLIVLIEGMSNRHVKVGWYHEDDIPLRPWTY